MPETLRERMEREGWTYVQAYEGDEELYVKGDVRRLVNSLSGKPVLQYDALSASTPFTHYPQS